MPHSTARLNAPFRVFTYPLMVEGLSPDFVFKLRHFSISQAKIVESTQRDSDFFLT